MWFQNSNLLSAVLCLVKELDYPSLEVAEMAVRYPPPTLRTVGTGVLLQRRGLSAWNTDRPCYAPDASATSSLRTRGVVVARPQRIRRTLLYKDACYSNAHDLFPIL